MSSCLIKLGRPIGTTKEKGRRKILNNNGEKKLILMEFSLTS